MVFEITSLLALFTLLALSAVVFYLARRFNVPYTVLLVAVGLLLVPLTNLPVLSSLFGFLREVELTPELLFYIFLPALIFESGFTMNLRTMLDNSWTILALAVGGLLISAFGVAIAMWLLLNALSIPVPFTLMLLFGAIISATDPVAVLALFKEFGAPRRLSTIFEGESLFNDGTAVALFLVVLGVIQNGFNGASTVTFGVIGFVVMVVSGVLIGLAFAGLFTAALRRTRADNFVSATLLIISAHLVFISTELINEQEWSIGELDLRVSSIIATTVAALFLGTYTRHSLTPTTEDYVEKTIGFLGFVVNSLVFILAGLLFASTDLALGEAWLAMLLAVLVVALMRVVAVFAVTGPINALGVDAGVPRTWQWLLSWGSLRGALAIIVVQLIPENLQVPGWQLETSPRDFLVSLTVSCILVTLFIKAPLIGPMMRRLRIDRPEPVELARRNDLARYYLLAEQTGFQDSQTRAVLHDRRAASMDAELIGELAEIDDQRAKLVQAHGEEIFERALRLTAIHVETVALRQIYVNEEISEVTYRRLHGKLQLQTELVTSSDLGGLDPHRSQDRRDIFDRLVEVWLTKVARIPRRRNLVEDLESARAQMILARRALAVLNSMQHDHASPVFLEQPFRRVIGLYEGFDQDCSTQLTQLAQDSASHLGAELVRMVELSRTAIGARAAHHLHANGVASESDEAWLTQTYSRSAAARAAQ